MSQRRAKECPCGKGHGARRVTHQLSLLSRLVQEPSQEKGSLPGHFCLIPMAKSKSHPERNNIKLDEPKYLEWRERREKENMNCRVANLEDWGERQNHTQLFNLSRVDADYRVINNEFLQSVFAQQY